ncbi:MAG: hypothetical protein JRJ84_02400 [Deltaproteobacteria bacterium]|nr:hypothetical protein [Deltaproteobacteria bacterium]
MSPEKPKQGADAPPEPAESLEDNDLAALEHLLSETEAALERAAALVGEDADALPDGVAEDQPEPAVDQPEPVAESLEPADPLADAKAVLEQARRVRGAEDEPPPIPAATASDPFSAAEEALRRARAARGVKEPATQAAGDAAAPDDVRPDLSRRVRDPFADAEAALEAAQSVRNRARVGQEGLLREAKARAELERLKKMFRSKGAPPKGDEPPEGPEDVVPKGDKKRRL